MENNRDLPAFNESESDENNDALESTSETQEEDLEVKDVALLTFVNKFDNAKEVIYRDTAKDLRLVNFAALRDRLQRRLKREFGFIPMLRDFEEEDGKIIIDSENTLKFQRRLKLILHQRVSFYRELVLTILTSSIKARAGDFTMSLSTFMKVNISLMIGSFLGKIAIKLIYLTFAITNVVSIHSIIFSRRVLPMLAAIAARIWAIVFAKTKSVASSVKRKSIK